MGLTQIQRMWAPCWLLASGNRPNDDKRLFAGRYGVGEWSVGRIVGEVFFAGPFTIQRSVGVACHGRVWFRAAWDSGLRAR